MTMNTTFRPSSALELFITHSVRALIAATKNCHCCLSSLSAPLRYIVSISTSRHYKTGNRASLLSVSIYDISKLVWEILASCKDSRSMSDNHTLAAITADLAKNPMLLLG